MIRSILRIFVVLVIMGIGIQGTAQTTISSGNWTDPTVWSTGVVPGGASAVNVINPLVLDQNITITTGTYSLFQNATDLPGGTAYTLTVNTAGGTFDVKAGTTTFEGAASWNNSTIFVRNGATLIVGPLSIGNNTTITVESGGTLIVNGNCTNNNNGTGSFSDAGLVQVNGNYSAPVGNVSLSGSGNLFTTGTITTTGSSNIFGSTNDCGTGPCSGNNLCSFSNSVTANQTLCSGSIPVALAGNVVASPTYNWESSTASSISGFGLASGTNNAQNYTPPSLTQTTWYRRKATSGGCTGISIPLQMTIVPSSGGWIGTTSNWNTASNWCNSTVPISTTDVSISTGVANMPQMTAASNCRDLIINPGATVTINGANTLSIFGSLTDNGTFTTNNSSVTFSGVAQQTIGGTSPIIFNNLTINNSSVISPQILTTNFINVNNAFTMTTGDINLSSYNLTVGTAAGSAGSLTWSAGKLFIGNLTRWFNTSTIAVGNVSGLFPVGSSADYRPFYIGYTSALTTGGTIRVGHTNAATTSVVSFADGGSTVVRRQDSFWTVATGNGLSVGATPFNVRAEGTGFGTVGAVTDLRLVRVGDVTGIGTSAASAGTTSNPQVNRTGLAVAGLTNNFYIGSINAVNSPLPITLLSFTGKRVPSGVELNWKTAQEINNDRFEIEQSLDGYEFSKVGTLNGFGNSNQVHEYKFIDKEVLLTSRYYYRLRQVDYNGTAHFSNTIVALALSELGPQWAVFPNPSSSDHPLQVRLTNSSQDDSHVVQMALYSLDGRILFKSVGSLRLLNQQAENDFANLPSGVYLIQIADGEVRENLRIVRY